MNTVSTRYALPLLLLMSAAAVPMIFSIVAPKKVEDCARPAAFLDPMRIDGNSEELPELPWEVTGPLGRISGILPAQQSRDVPLEFAIFRAWGLPPRFLQPIPPARLEPDRTELREILAGETTLPVHIVSQQLQSETRFAAYYFVYDGEPVMGAFGTRIRSAFDELIHGSRPLTVIRIMARTPSRFYLQRARERADAWLVKAWGHYQQTCRSSAEIELSQLR